jgi:hypothetical protein
LVQAEESPGVGASSVDRERGSIEGHVKSLFSSRVMISLNAVVSRMFAFVILGILDVEHKKTTKIIRVVIVLGMSVYLVVAHAGDVVNLFRTVDGKVNTARRASEKKRGKSSQGNEGYECSYAAA